MHRLLKSAGVTCEGFLILRWSVSQVKAMKTVPKEVVEFMDKVIQSLETLGRELATAERSYEEKTTATLEAERDARLKLQNDNANLREELYKVPEGLRKKMEIRID